MKSVLQSILLTVVCMALFGCGAVPTEPEDVPRATSIALYYKCKPSDMQSFLRSRCDAIPTNAPHVRVWLWRNTNIRNQREWDFEIPEANIVGYADYMIREEIQSLSDHRQDIPLVRIEKDLIALLPHLKIEGAEVRFSRGLMLKRQSHNH